MEVNVISQEGIIFEQIKLPTKTTPQCISKFKYSYNHETLGDAIYNPINYIGYKFLLYH